MNMPVSGFCWASTALTKRRSHASISHASGEISIRRRQTRLRLWAQQLSPLEMFLRAGVSMMWKNTRRG